MIKKLGIVAIFLSLSSHALVPVEGILMGEAVQVLQTDPLQGIFRNIYDKSDKVENRKIKLYFSTYESGQNLNESCTYLGVPVYSSTWKEKQAHRSIAATLQYIGLDTSIKAIGAYAKKMEVGEEDFKRLSANLVKNYCSKNVTVFSLRNIEKSLEHYYQNPVMDFIPSVASSPFATQIVKDMTEKTSARSREFDLVIKNFRAFCSWGGQVEDYRLLTPYLKNKYIMSFVIKNMIGIQDKIHPREEKVTTEKSVNTVQVSCTDLICRKESLDIFREKFPLTVGSTGIVTDLPKLFCHHFRFQDESHNTVPQVKKWIKAQELEDPIFETSQFISLMTGVPDFFNGVDTYIEIPMLVKSSIDERWGLWANRVLGAFSKDFLYEESLKVKVSPRRDLASLRQRGFEMDFSVTLGEMDRLLKSDDKLDVSFDLKLSKNYLRSIKSKWKVLQQEVNMEGQQELKDEVAKYISIQLKLKEKLFTQKMWNEDFPKLLAAELIEQTIKYEGPLFNSYQDEMLRVPVKFSYGLFALSYLRYRADVAAGRLKLNL